MDVTAVFTSVAAQGPLVAFMFWVIWQTKQDLKDEKARHDVQVTALTERTNQLTDMIVKMHDSALAVISGNTQTISVLTEKLNAIKA